MSFIQSLRDNSDDESYKPCIFQSTSLIDTLKKESGEDLDFYGIEQVCHLKLNNNGQIVNKFFCNICAEWATDFKSYDILLHCSSLVHIFRYVCKTYPKEYNRMNSFDTLDEKIKGFKTFLNAIESHLDHKRKFQEYDKIFSSKEFKIEMDQLKHSVEPIKIHQLVDLQARDDRIDSARHDTILANIKKDKLSPRGFFSNHLKEESDEDMDLPNENYNNKKSSFNTNFNSDMKPNLAQVESDIDTDYLEELDDEVEKRKMVKKKALKVIKNKKLSDKFINIYGEYVDYIDDDITEEIMKILELTTKID